LYKKYNGYFVNFTVAPAPEVLSNTNFVCMGNFELANFHIAFTNTSFELSISQRIVPTLTRVIQ